MTPAEDLRDRYPDLLADADPAAMQIVDALHRAHSMSAPQYLRSAVARLPIGRSGVGVEASLVEEGIWVRDGFLMLPQVRSLADCAHTRRNRGDFAAARIGNDRTLQRREEIRGDSTCWIVPPLFPAEQALLDQLELLRLQLNRDCMLGLFELEVHFAWYPPGAGYARHSDQPLGREQRRGSLVLYLNEDWTEAAGGELRVFEADDRYRDIAPVAGRLVCFLTAGREHEVLPTRRDRLSVSGWFRIRH